jgi:hypothetical protein
MNRRIRVAPPKVDFHGEKDLVFSSRLCDFLCVNDNGGGFPLEIATIPMKILFKLDPRSRLLSRIFAHCNLYIGFFFFLKIGSMELQLSISTECHLVLFVWSFLDLL